MEKTLHPDKMKTLHPFLKELPALPLSGPN
jgi:hypothetical protein